MHIFLTFRLGLDFSKDTTRRPNNRLSRVFQQHGTLRVKRIIPTDKYHTDFAMSCQANIPLYWTVSNEFDGMNDAQTAFKWKRKIVINGVTR